jgi:hypothetical protein
MRAVANGDTSIGEEIEIDGVRKIIHNSAVPIRDANERITAAVVVNEDISANKAAERALNDSYHQMRTLTASLMRAQDDERRRIAQMLHETTAQNLAALKMLLARLKGASDRLNDGEFRTFGLGPLLGQCTRRKPRVRPTAGEKDRVIMRSAVAVSSVAGSHAAPTHTCVEGWHRFDAPRTWNQSEPQTAAPSDQQLWQRDEARERRPAAPRCRTPTARTVQARRAPLGGAGHRCAGMTKATGRPRRARPGHQSRRPRMLHIARGGRPVQVVETVVALLAVVMIRELVVSRSDERHQHEAVHIAQMVSSRDLERDQVIAFLVRPALDQLVATADATPRRDVVGRRLRNGRPEL